MSPASATKEAIFPSILEEVRAALPAPEVYLVGGAVRDSLLGRPVYDIDITLRGDGISAARSAANTLGAACYPLDAERGVGRVILVRQGCRFTLDFASLRGDLAADLAARDFTINAIAQPLATGSSLIDPLGGERDLRAGILRACSPTSISDDPVRAIRAVRLANQLVLQMEKGTREQVRAGGARLSSISAERVRDEFFRILAGENVANAARLLAELGLLVEILPETAGLAETDQPPPHHADVWTHTLLAVEKLEALLAGLHGGPAAAGQSDPALVRAIARLEHFGPAVAPYLSRPLSDDRPARGLVFLAAILHDAGKPETRSVDPLGEVHFLGHEQMGEEWTLRRATALRFSNEEAHFTARIVRHHTRPILLRVGGPITRRAVFRFFRATGPSGVAVSLFSLADTLATYCEDLPAPLWDECVDMAATLLEGFFERPAEWVSPVMLLTGNDLIREFGLVPGPQIGEILDALREAQAGGEITTREEALALAARGIGRPAG